MRKLGSWLLLILALFMISTVTIWGPERITQDVLSKIVPERKTQQDKDVVVRVQFDKPLMPHDNVRLDVEKMVDLAGNEAHRISTAKIESDDKTPPRLTGAVLMTDPGQQSVTVAAIFDEELRDGQAQHAASNYVVECPPGKRLTLIEPALYDASARSRHMVILKAKAKVDAGAAFRVAIPPESALEDLAGNKIDGSRSQARQGKAIQAKLQDLAHAEKAVQDLAADPLGKTIAITFSRPLDPKAAAAAVYRTKSGIKARSAVLDAGGRTVRVKMPLVILPQQAASQIDVDGLVCADGTRVPFCPYIPVQPQEKTPPQLSTFMAEAVAGSNNDTAIVTFSENVLAADATDLGNYALERVSNPLQGAQAQEQIGLLALPLALSQTPANVSAFGSVVSHLMAPQTAAIALDASSAAYDVEKRQVTITIKGANLVPGEVCRITCRNVRDVAGNAIAAGASAKARVGGDREAPTVAKVLQDLSKDSTGATLLVRFSEAVDMATADRAHAFALSHGLKPVLTKAKGDNGVYVLVDHPVIPGETTVTIRGVQDLACNSMAVAKDVKIEPLEQRPPTIARLRGAAVKGIANDAISIAFSEPVVPKDATDLANYEIESPPGTRRTLAGATIAYDAMAHVTHISLTGVGKEAVNLKKGEPILVRVSKVRDLGGNRIKAGAMAQSLVEGDSSPPGIRQALLNKVVDKTGATVDLLFTEAVAPATAAKLSSYSVLKGPAIKSIQTLGGGQAVRIVFAKPVAMGSGGYGWLIVAVVAVMCYMILARLARDMASGMRNMLRVVVVLIVIAAVIVSATSEKEPVKLRAYGVTDLAGNPARALAMPPIERIEKEQPRVVDARIALPTEPGQPAELRVSFSEAVTPEDAVNAANYKLYSPLAQLRPLGEKIVYQPTEHMSRIILPLGGEPFKVGEAFKVNVANVRDLAGNQIAAGAEFSGIVGGDLKPPTVVKAQHRWEKLDLIDYRDAVEDKVKLKGYGSKVGKGNTTDIDFSEPLDPVSAEDADNYLIFGGPRTLVAMLDEDDPKKVWVSFAGRLVPGETKILLRNIKDKAGNIMPIKTDLMVEPEELAPPKVIRSQANAVSGIENDTIFVTFDEEVVADDAKNPANYTVESPPGQPISITGCKVSYNAPTSTTSIVLTNGTNLQTGKAYKITVKGVRDVSGNKITENGKDNVIHGVVRGDRSRPLARLVTVTQRMSKDSTGCTVDIRFEEAINKKVALNKDNYTTTKGHKVLSVQVCSVEKVRDETLMDAVDTVSADAIKAHMTALAQLPRGRARKSRMSGTLGNKEARDYVVNELKKLGFEPRIETFKVVVPIEHKAEMTAQTPSGPERFKLAAFWPNKVRTCSLPKEGLDGFLVNGGDGELAELNGNPIKGAVVLMKFGSGMSYFNARMMGASAILFYDDGNVSASQAEDKFIEVPAPIPRFWVDRNQADRLMALAKTNTPVRLEAKVDWEERETWNVYACLEGADEFMPPRGDEEPRKWKDQIVALEAYYDSISVVPDLAPGADSTAGAASLLELAKFLKQHYRPKYSILFLFTSGHFEGLSGINDFVYRHIRKSEYYLERMAVKDKIEYLFYKDAVGRIGKAEQIEELEDEGILRVKLATRADIEAGNAVRLWGGKYALLDDSGHVIVGKDEEGEISNMTLRLFIGLDISTHNDQVASFAEATFYNYGWRTDNYKQNALAPFAKKFFEYYENAFPPGPEWEAKAKTRDITYLETRGYVNAVTPSKRSWRHYMQTPLALDHEAVTWVGHFAISMATPQDLRKWLDTPNDTLGRVGEAGMANVYKQTHTLAALLGQAGRDDKFIPDSKLELKDLGHNMKGNVVWFDRNVNFFVPKAPVGGALMTYQMSNTRSRSGVRTMMVARTTPKSPSGGNEQKGWKVETITADSTRIRVKAWNRTVKNITRKRIEVQTRYGRFAYDLKPSKDEAGVWTSGQVHLNRKVHGYSALIAPGIICGVVALICLGLVYFIKDIPRPAELICYTSAAIVLGLFMAWTAKVVITRHNDPRLAPKQTDLNLPWHYAMLTKLELDDGNDAHRIDFKPVDVSFGSYEGQFFFDVRRHRWTIFPTAYSLDDEGDIVMAPDRGNEGDKTYPIASHYGWWETNVLQVLFPCRALTVFDTVDSRYLTALDYSTVLGSDDAVPQWWGEDQVLYQSRSEGKTVEVAVYYAKPGQRVKILMSTGLLGVKYMLTNAPEDLFTHKAMVTPANVNGKYGDFHDSIYPDAATRPFIPRRERRASIKLMARGRGYPVDMGVLFNPAYEGTKDMWVIDDARMKELAKYGVRNDKISQLHERAKLALESAGKSLHEQKYDRFMAAAREAWGLEARGYPDVKKTANDTVKGIVFYFMLLLPFSYFAERLLFGFADVRKRLIGFGCIFVLVFLVLRMVHPAFKLSMSPYIIFLAFITFALGGAVLFMVMAKFNQEVQKIKRAAAGMHEADVGRLSATYAAINLGISNLRRRKVRTSLTAATLILLTFTVLSFTSVSSSLKYYKLPRDNRPTYQGALVRDRNWKGLQESVLSYLQSAFEGKATIIPRSWKMGRIQTEKQYIAFNKVGNDKPSFANALLGLTENERLATRVDQFLIGEHSRWFKDGDRYVCILPSDMAALVGITEDDIRADPAKSPKIRMLGQQLTVIGIIDSDRFNRTRDLDDEKLTPVDMVSEGQRMRSGQREDPDLQASEPIESFVHLESTNVMLLPYDYVMDIGGTLRSLAITNFKNPKIGQQIEDFMSRVAMTVFVGERDTVTVYSSIGATSLGGLANLAIPILIAALIVLNTMLGSVYERFREIGIFSSVGLAPTHIAALFLAEAAVFATVGAVMGYLVGQVATMSLSGLGLLKGMNLNYSSLSAISSTLVVMATVFLSTLYPARKAASMAVPDVTRKWKFPEPEGDRWVFDFPFTIGGAEVVGMYAYLAKIFESYGEGSTGGFVAEDVKLSSSLHEGMDKYTITMRTWLAPYDLGISQDVVLDGIPTGEHNVYRVEVVLQRLSGDVASWRRINRGFLNVLRKRFLVWRTVSPEEKLEYREEGLRILGATTAAG